ncbi:hypothetical protein HK101_002176, partial [Irineochytrium annulatum]
MSEDVPVVDTAMAPAVPEESRAVQETMMLAVPGAEDEARSGSGLAQDEDGGSASFLTVDMAESDGGSTVAVSMAPTPAPAPAPMVAIPNAGRRPPSVAEQAPSDVSRRPDTTFITGVVVLPPSEDATKDMFEYIEGNRDGIKGGVGKTSPKHRPNTLPSSTVMLEVDHVYKHQPYVHPPGFHADAISHHFHHRNVPTPSNASHHDNSRSGTPAVQLSIGFTRPSSAGRLQTAPAALQPLPDDPDNSLLARSSRARPSSARPHSESDNATPTGQMKAPLNSRSGSRAEMSHGPSTVTKENGVPHPVRPLTPVTANLIRTQTVRTNLDRYRIEQVALRRLRFVIENNEAEPEHISIMDLVEAGNVPKAMFTRYFGSNYTNAHDVRILLLQSIEKTKRIQRRLNLSTAATHASHRATAAPSRMSTAAPRAASSAAVMHPARPESSYHHYPARMGSPEGLDLMKAKEIARAATEQAVAASASRRGVRTPAPVLAMLEQAERGSHNRVKKLLSVRRVDVPLSEYETEFDRILDKQTRRIAGMVEARRKAVAAGGEELRAERRRLGRETEDGAMEEV